MKAMKRLILLWLLIALCGMLAACRGPLEHDPTGETTGGSGTARIETETLNPEASLPAELAFTVRELCFTRDGQWIYGELYLPEGDGPFPAVIIGHGLDANLSDTEGFAKIFARYGIAAYVFDFIGGGSEIRSDGDILDMTVLTEKEDMLTVLDGIRALDAVDVGKIFLMGCSQGGYVATCAAAERAVYVRGLIAFYPAYGLMDDVKERTANGNHITEETTNVNGVEVSPEYMEAVLSFNIFDTMKKYTGGVLIVHGTDDEVTPIYYSERASETFENAKLIEIDGAEHGFRGEDESYAAECAVLFIQSLIGR